MKELKSLERGVRLICCVHLALMTLCLSLSVALLYPGERVEICLLWAFGAVIPVQIIHQVCLRVRELLPRCLVCAVVTLCAVLLPDNGLRRFYYGLCCVPILLAGLCLNRPHGRLVLTVPQLYHPLIPLFVYVFGMATRTELLPGFAVALTALMALSYCFYRNQEKTLRILRDALRAEISAHSIVRLNRRATVIFALLGILVLAAVPWLMNHAEVPEPMEPFEPGEAFHTDTKEITEPTLPDIGLIQESGSQRPLHFEGIYSGMIWAVALFLVSVIGLVIFAVISDLLSISKGNGKHSDPQRDQEWTVERLTAERSDKKQAESAAGWDRKLRRRYEKLIRSRARRGVSLRAMTPAELEAEARLAGPGAETVHRLYEQTRYSQSPADRERLAAFKAAVKTLEPQPPREKEGEG